MSEAKIQADAFIEFWNNYPEFRGAFYHNYNNPRNAVNGARLKAVGLITGNPDMTLALPRGGFGALYIEIKKPGEKPRPEQLLQHEKLRSFGNKVVVCFSKDEILFEIKKYINLPS